MSHYMCESLLPLYKRVMSGNRLVFLADGAFSGAVKWNIGHLEGTSGIAGIIKAILAVEKGIIPPNTNFERLNTQIDAEFFNLEVTWFPYYYHLYDHAVKLTSLVSFEAYTMAMSGHTASFYKLFWFWRHQWPCGSGRCLSLSSRQNLRGNHFTAIEPQTDDLNRNNEPVLQETAHISNVALMKEFPAKLLVWSAADEEGLSRLSSLYSQHFKERRHIVNEKLIDDLAFTLNTRRNSLAWKSFVVVKSFNDLLSLDQVVSKPIHAAVKSPRVGFVFTGQGAQWYGMGRKLSYIRRSTWVFCARK